MCSGWWCLWYPGVVLEKGGTLGDASVWVPNPGMVPKRGHTLDGVQEPKCDPQAGRYPRWFLRPGMVSKGPR